MGWTRFFHRGRRDDELAREIASYIAIETDENIARGMTPQEAHAAAVRKFGNATQVREEIFWMNTIRPLDTLWQDLRYAARLLRRDKGFAAAAIISLALGIGANTAIFQLLDVVRLRVLPVSDPARLVEVRIPPGTGRSGSFTGRRPMMTYPLFDEISKRQHAVTGLFAWHTGRFNAATGGEVRRLEVMLASGNMFESLGVRPVIGRPLNMADDQPSCVSPAAVVSYAYWQREFGGTSDVLQKTVQVEGVLFDVIGVAPPDFFGLDVGRRFDVVLPLCSDRLMNPVEKRAESRSDWWLSLVGRLAPGETEQTATRKLNAVAPGIMEATLPSDITPDDVKTYREYKLAAMPAGTGMSNLRTQFAEPLVVLLSATGLVLLIACANLANLLLARAGAREKEIAVRLAIGAARRRIITQLLIESVLLATLGTVLGVFVASALTELLIAQLAAGLGSIYLAVGWNLQVLGFTIAVSAMACVLFGLMPAFRATAVAPSAALRAGGRGITAGRPERFGLRRVLVVTQVALSSVLLIGALLFTRTLYNLLTIDTGFNHRVTIAFLTDDVLGGDVDRGNMLRDTIQARIAELPGVAGVAQADYVPLGGSFWNEFVSVDGLDAEKKVANFTRIGAGYFETLEIPLLSGRVFDQRDTRQSQAGAIVNAAFVNKMMAGQDPLGRVIRVDAPAGQPQPVYQIVGVVGNARHTGLREDFEPVVHLASSQANEPRSWVRLVIKTAGAGVTRQAILRRIEAVNPAIDVEFSDLAETITNGLVRERLMAALSAALGLLAVVLAAVGLYGVLSYMVVRRANEIGIRLAMGATRRAVSRLVIGEAAWLVGIGLAIGVALGLGAARAARTLLFGLQPTDPLTMVAATALLASIGFFAAYLPARRASKLDPMTTLRQD
jgi:predicted permease